MTERTVAFFLVGYVVGLAGQFAWLQWGDQIKGWFRRG